MHTLLLGINHKTAPVEVREKLHFDDTAGALNRLTEYKNINAGVILSTCNRVEIYVTANKVEKGFTDLISFISEYHSIEPDHFIDSIYKCSCEEAVKHLFHVVSSLDSMVLGEMQIQGQVRTAYQLAHDIKATDSVLNKLFQTAIQVGKRIRSETNISEGAVSVGSVAVDLIKDIFSEHPVFKTMLVGAGKMSVLTAKSLARHNNCEIIVTNRSREAAETLADQFDGSVVDFDTKENALLESDVVVVSTGAPDYVIDSSLKDQLAKRANVRPIYLIDISVPRNIDPTLNEIDNVYVYSVDSLKELILKNEQRRRDEVDDVLDIIQDLSKDYNYWYARQTVIPVMKGLKHEFHDLGVRMLDNQLAELGDITEQQQVQLQGLMENYSDKIIKIIMKNLQNITDVSDLASIAKSLQQTFNINVEDK